MTKTYEVRTSNIDAGTETRTHASCARPTTTPTEDPMTITYPTARDLDTIGRACAVAVYLDPTDRSLYTSEGDGTPMPAWRGLHAHVTRVPPMADGESVLAALRACETEIAALADCHEGDYWGGGTRHGRWADDTYARVDAMDRALERALRSVEDGGHLRQAQDAADWLAVSRPTWASLCEDAGVDPERRDDDAVQAVVDDLEAVAEADGVILAHTERAVRRYLDHADD